METGQIIEGRMDRITPDGLVLLSDRYPNTQIFVKPDFRHPFRKDKVVPVYLLDRGPGGSWLGSLDPPPLGLDEVDFLQVAEEIRGGYRLDWEMDQELILPLSEVNAPVHKGMWVPVRMVKNERTGKLQATMHWKKGMKPVVDEYEKGSPVQILVMETTELGHLVLVDRFFSGLLYFNQTFEPLRTGEKRAAWVNKVREDGKLDLLLRKPGYAAVDDASEMLLKKLKQAGGRLNLGDKSPPELISETLGMSKKTFKKALGALYREGLVALNDQAFWEISQDGD
jgi:uncharacterized protein